ncbi:MAG: LPS export ABC transporter periplasmic protein LptC [Sphingobacteriaceae bacterium]|nr:LPS export ABC transporter periplasmic protein LptC [Sphingobacteriaceae bacterium]
MKINSAFIFLLGSLFIIACENDVREIEKISSRKVSIAVDTSKGVEIILSDSATVKGKLITPLLLQFKVAAPYNEMPNGLVVIFYDENQAESSRIVADHGISRNNGDLIELRKNVVVTTKKGDTFKSEELFYDSKKKIFYSNQLVNITKPDGTSINGTNFQSDQKFDNPVIQNATGSLATGDKLTY